MSNVTGKLTTAAAAGTISSLLLAVLMSAGCKSDGSAVSSSDNGGAEAVVLREASIEAGVPTVAVDRLMRRPNDYAGRLAVQGVVVRSVPERGALVLVDVDEFKSCGLNACTDAAMPVRIAPGSYEGALPQPGAFVTVIGDYEADERGFAFELVEIHHEGGVVLARRTESES